MKVCAISANLGSYDPPHEWEPQILSDNVELAIYRLDDQNFPPRHKAMTSRLQCGIPKWFGWRMFKGEVFVWVDASCRLSHPKSVMWFVEQLGDADIALFRHPDRSTIQAEYEFCTRKIREGNRYLNDRYANEFWGLQMRTIEADREFKDTALYASTAFIYRPTEAVKNAFKEIWSHKTQFLLHDQLALAYWVAKSGLKVNVINEHYMKTPYLEYVRNKKAVSA